MVFPVFQIRVDGIPPDQNALLYETVTVVEGKPILRDMVFSPDHQYIYLLSDRQVNTPEPVITNITVLWVVTGP